MKTINKAAKEFVNTNFAIDDYVQEEELIKSFEAGVRFAEQWISVEKELPEIYKEATAYNILLLKTEINGETTGITLGYLKSDCWYTQLGKVKTESVTHWRPINKK